MSTLEDNSNLKVYFVQWHEDGPIKIGCSTNVPERIESIQTGCPYKLKMLGTMPGGYDIERKIHKQFELENMRGEWYWPTRELKTFIEANRLETAEMILQAFEEIEESTKKTGRRPYVSSKIKRHSTCKICKSPQVDIIDAYLIDNVITQAELIRRMAVLYPDFYLTRQNVRIHALRHVQYPSVANDQEALAHIQETGGPQ